MAILDTSRDLVANFLAQVRATPHAPALEDIESTWSYAELDELTASLATRLQQLGVGRDDLVGVLMGRCADYVIASLAALRAGGAFLVLELAYPPKLLTDVVDDANPKLIVTKEALGERLNNDTPRLYIERGKILPTSTTILNVETNPKTPAPKTPAEDDLEKLAFVSYSSGTTGKPKGIANPHRAPVESYDRRFEFNNVIPGDRVACNVFFVWEMLRPLLRGATAVAVPDEISYDPMALAEFLCEKKITETLMTPTLLSSVLAQQDAGKSLNQLLGRLRTLWLNGEVVTTDLARRALEVLDSRTRLLNCYSASETHEIACGDIRSMLAHSDIAEVCPVGQAMDKASIRILEEDGQTPVEHRKSGELYVGGSMLARGYLNLPDTTAKSFVPDPSGAHSARMYRTGDRARLTDEGVLEITGRVGAMIKLRGYSIQPGLVENAIVEHMAVRQCVVTDHGDGLNRQLVAYVVPEEGRGENAVIIDDSGYSPAARRVLSQHLAQYMIPTIWVLVDTIPTHAVSGKADTKALPPPPSPKTKSEDVSSSEWELVPAPVDDITSIGHIAQEWAACLNIDPRSVTEEHSFFDLGGHSLALADLANRLSKKSLVPVPVAPLVANPTLAGHLTVLQAARRGRVAAMQADLAAMLRSDSVLPADIRPTSNNVKPQVLSQADAVLLTGVTGFLGAFLLKDILAATSGKVICLVRFEKSSENDRLAGMARIRKHLLDLGVWEDALMDRIEILPGNLAKERLGLSATAFDDLALRVQVIVHAAATVNLVYPYTALRGPNVQGTVEILRLASQSGATIHHVSTNGVLPPSTEARGWSEDSHVGLDDAVGRLADGYGQTKWVAEQLVQEATKRGVPARIYRPGTISGHSKSGATNAWDLLSGIFSEALHIGYAPEIEGWRAEMTPIDFVSKAITTLCNDTDTSQVVFHLGDPSPKPVSATFDMFADLGLPTKRLGWKDWVKVWREKRESTVLVRKGDDLTPQTVLRGNMPTEAFLKEVTVLDDSETRPVLEKHGVRRPANDVSLLETYAMHYCARGWLATLPRRVSPKPKDHITPDALTTPVNTRGPLAGKVAIITGASSGIGAAIAVALAKEGAHIALAARRTDALEAVKVECLKAAQGLPVRILTHKTDVTAGEQVKSLVDTTMDTLGPVDMVIACAGVMYYTMMANARLAEWDQTVDVNCKGLLHCLATAVPGMLARGSGHIVAISSDAGRKVFPGLGVYSASKMFVEGTLQALRVETAGSGLRITSIQPGNVSTDLLGMSTDAEAIKKYGEPSGAKVLQPADVANAVVYALRQPSYVAVNEILVEPRDEPI